MAVLSQGEGRRGPGAPGPGAGAAGGARDMAAGLSGDSRVSFHTHTQTLLMFPSFVSAFSTLPSSELPGSRSYSCSHTLSQSGSTWP